MRAIVMALSFVTAVTAMPVPVLAWNDDGHKIVALVAAHYLAPAARDKVNRMLAADTDKSTAHDLASEATWADKYPEGSQPAGGEVTRTAAWHFIDLDAGRPNIPLACHGQPPLPAGTPASQGPANACIVDKINQFAKELGAPATTAEERLLAVKYLLSLVADIHQPLRVADEGNHHGTALGVTAAYMTPGNLFDFWDSTLVTRLSQGASPEQVASMLISRISEADAHAWAARAPQLWALEAYQLGVDRAYGMAGIYDDQGRSILQGREIDQALQTVALQLSRAGVRLAYVLNEALAPTPLPPSTVVAAGDPAMGGRFAIAVCRQCHAVEPGKTMSNMAPDFQAVAMTAGISANALKDFLQGPHPSMPNIRLTQKQTDDLVAYIISLQNK